jgi:serine phosphatase RsbU (regulator of sigma subunit)
MFRQAMSTTVGGGNAFVTGSLWRLNGSSPQLIAEVGAAPLVPVTTALMRAAEASRPFFVTELETPHALHRFVFIVGDVSGRGVRAAAVMASLQFAGRAYAQEGYCPAMILERLSRSVDIERDAHFATVLCGVADVTAHTMLLASAGHLPPLDVLIAYTDGLVERRGEMLDVGLERLQAAASLDSSSLDNMLSGIVTVLSGDTPTDDIALIGLKWLT